MRQRKSRKKDEIVSEERQIPAEEKKGKEAIYRTDRIDYSKFPRETKEGAIRKLSPRKYFSLKRSRSGG